MLYSLLRCRYGTFWFVVVPTISPGATVTQIIVLGARCPLGLGMGSIWEASKAHPFQMDFARARCKAKIKFVIITSAGFIFGWFKYGRLSQPIWAHMGPYARIWAHMGANGRIWAHTGTYECIWAHMGPYGCGHCRQQGGGV